MRKQIQRLNIETPKMMRIMPTHLTEKTWHKYLIEQKYNPKTRSIRFPVYEMPYDAYLYISSSVGGTEDNIIINIMPNDRLINKSSHDNDMPDVPEDLIKLINYCIIHGIEFITFYGMNSMMCDYNDDVDEYYSRIVPDLPSYDWKSPELKASDCQLFITKVTNL